MVADAQQWVTLRNCSLIAHDANDGDSFHVRAGGKEYIFRLYFADCPETDKQIPERVAMQARYFKISESKILDAGRKAEIFTRTTLAKPFTVVTCWQDARGASHMSRYFAYVLPEGHPPDLASRLVQNGLARAYGASASILGKSENSLWTDYDKLQKQAQVLRLEVWAESSRTPHRAQKKGA